MNKYSIFILLCLIACKGPQGVKDKGYQFLSFLEEGEFQKAQSMCNESMSIVLSKDGLRNLWEDLTLEHGLYRRSWESKEQVKFYSTQVVIVAEFDKEFIEIALIFDMKKKIVSILFRPLDREKKYIKDTNLPENIIEKEIYLGKKPLQLPATLTLPSGDGPFPAIILVHDFGPHDRDETIGPNKPFRDIAHGLAKRKVAVLRYPKRSYKYRKELIQTKTPLDVDTLIIDDILSAVKRLIDIPSIDKKRVWLLGHGLGAKFSIRTAFKSNNIRGLILLGAMGRNLEDVIMQKMNYLKAQSKQKNDIKYIEKLKQSVRRVKENLVPTTKANQLPFNIPASFWISLKRDNPIEIVQKLRIPMLFLQANKDYQTLQEDFQIWKKALSKHSLVRYKEYSDLHHFFIKTEQKSEPSQYKIKGHVSEKVLSDIKDFIFSFNI